MPTDHLRSSSDVRWINPEKGRYYHAHLDNDLFGGWTLVLACGGLRNRRGNMLVNPVSSYEDGMQRIQAIDKRRRRRCYCPAGEISSTLAA